MCGGAAGWEREIASSAGARARFGFKINPNFSAGRARKRRSTFGSGAELCQAALRLLDRHQNLNDLLLEVGAGFLHCGVLFLVSVLQEQASRLGVPAAVLAAKNAVTNIEQICQPSASPSQVPLLNLDQRVSKKLSCLLQTVKDLLVNNVFSRSRFCQEIWKMQVRTHKERLLVEEIELNVLLFVLSNPDAPAVVEWLCSSLCALCEQAEEPSQDAELAGSVLSDFAITFLQNGFQQTSELGRTCEFKKVPNVRTK
uniref:Fanconi anaemia group A protein N-terminal domain-containing protein n=1 Tax=Anas platyrhynchos platyrhynchos TaxID=8840 RepID=A0A493SWC0_ANAPP